jgi:large subunit ribosomal protein L29
MKASDIRDLSVDQLDEKLAELQLELFNSKFNKSLGTLENPGVIKGLRKDIARIKTIMVEKA